MDWVAQSGFAPVEADAPDRALERLDDTGTAIALCNVAMPGDRGVTLARAIRERCATTAIIVSTSLPDIDVAVSSLENGVVDYLLAPFDQVRLGEALSLAIDWHRASLGAQQLQDSIQDRLRARRTMVAAALAEAQSSSEDALDGLIAMLQLHEKDSRGHATRVAWLALALADELGAPDREIATIERGALLHDVGKLDIPSAILGKPAPLTDDEWLVMRTHPKVGYDLVRQFPVFSESSAELVLTHHEAFDGSGYPEGLQGQQIPRGARILSVADAYDSMTHPHTQRPALSPSMAVAEIQRCSGSQFDPEAVGALGRVMSLSGTRSS